MTFHISSTVSMGSFVIKYHGSFFIRPTTSQSCPAYFACRTGSATTLILRQHRFCTSHTSFLATLLFPRAISHNFFSFPSLSPNLCPCFHRITNRSFNMQRYSHQGPPTYPRSKICITLLPHLPATSQASFVSCSRWVLASFPFLVHKRIVATPGTPCIPRSNIPIHSIPQTVIGFPVGGFHTPFLCFFQANCLT